MTNSTQTFSWRFGGWLSEQSPAVAWTVLGACAVGGAGLIAWSYRSALAELSPLRRRVLGALRSAVLLTLLVILAAPTRVERIFEVSTAVRPLAVLVDRSGSMTTPDNRQRRRLDDALLRWRELEPLARKTTGPLKTFAFADGFSAIATADTAAALPADQTQLFQALQRTLAAAPAGGWGGVITLTDGLDTSPTGSAQGTEATVRAALATNTPLYFAPGRNRYAGGAFFALRELNVPAQTMPRSLFRLDATFDSYQATAKTIEVQLKVDGVARPAQSLKLETGRRLATWSAEIQTDQPGVIELELRAGDEIARTAVRIEPPTSTRILYFQGALDWGYRFLADIVKRDSSVVLTPVFNFPNPKALLPPGALGKMPTTAAELSGFNLIILANAAARQFTTEQQTAISNWVRDGGVLLFLTPDDDSTQGFAGSELEKMLPVVFLPPQPASASRALAQLRTRARIGAGGSADTPQLTPYAWEDTPRVREIFAEATAHGGAPATPVFSAYAHVARAKPGAEVLARHPDDTISGSDEHAILLALQRYGRGQSAVLTTDALWRWKLNQPSTGRGAELFWQNLFAWLSRDSQRGLRFERAPLHVQTGQEVAFRLDGAGSEKLTVTATLGSQRLTLNEASADGTRRVFAWKPPSEGFWQITASDANGREARHWLSVDKTVATGEFSGQAPDEELLRTLAARTNGAVLEKEAPAAWRETRTASELLAERRQPLWHNGWILGGLLAFYGTELILRRKWHLL